MPTAPAAPWLDEDEMRLWRAWLRVQTELPAAMGRALHEDSDLSLQDFETLVRLSESGEGRLRVSALADEMHWERSRLSHHLRRMGARGLVEKVECPEDGRGSFVVLTPAGREALEGAAPDHVRTVRQVFLDGMSAQERDALLRVLTRVLDRVDPA
ncbi:MarR family winged helix-turn-helix transcriptional regulator [Serinicoccus chungangensis]|uniref:MarR family winged helix-turn-helix transcriptional regulator n=1 Tax=Serinicoccus chungangensis TaxID=767452 RepID=UPI001476D10B|nr:MarR family transcriptional regulator [Serinicoccus chungangensis]